MSPETLLSRCIDRVMADDDADADALATQAGRLEQAEAALDAAADAAAAASVAGGSSTGEIFAGSALAVICGLAPVPPAVAAALLLVSELLTARAERPRAWREHSRQDAYLALAYACVRCVQLARSRAADAQMLHEARR